MHYLSSILHVFSDYTPSTTPLTTTTIASTERVSIETTNTKYLTGFEAVYIPLLLIALAGLALFCFRHKIHFLWRRLKDKFITVPVQEQPIDSEEESENSDQREKQSAPHETETLVQQHKDINSNNMKPATTITEIRDPEGSVPERKKEKPDVSIENSSNYSVTEADESQYVDIQSIQRKPEQIYANVNELLRNDRYGRRGRQNISTNSVDGSETDSDNSEDDGASDHASTEKSEKEPRTLTVVTEFRFD